MCNYAQGAIKNYKNMSSLHLCDKCKKQITEAEVLLIRVDYVRTPEEIDQLMQSPMFKDCFPAEVKSRSAIRKDMEVCRDCYNQFKKDYFA